MRSNASAIKTTVADDSFCFLPSCLSEKIDFRLKENRIFCFALIDDRDHHRRRNLHAPDMPRVRKLCQSKMHKRFRRNDRRTERAKQWHRRCRRNCLQITFQQLVVGIVHFRAENYAIGTITHRILRHDFCQRHARRHQSHILRLNRGVCSPIPHKWHLRAHIW